jgi:nicotinamide-nucleotide adenylyltransferase
MPETDATLIPGPIVGGDMTTRGFFIGRFQPFHDGHRRVVETIADEVDELVIGIGSAGESHSVHDPFTAGERIMMITKTIFEHDMDLVTYTVPIEDIERNSVWVSHVQSLCPRFDVIYSHNPLVIRLFEEAGLEVEEFPMYSRDRLEGTRIREAIVDDEEWRPLVPDPVEGVIDEIDGAARLRKIAGSDASDGGTGFAD